jgi:hypothetical protein
MRKSLLRPAAVTISFEARSNGFRLNTIGSHIQIKTSHDSLLERIGLNLLGS